MRGSHGWAEIDAKAKRAIIRGIVTGKPTRGPVHAEIDVTDRCNVACYFCNQQDVRTKEQISLGHLMRLVDELAAGGLKSVRMSGGGDPLFHSAIGEFLDHLHARGVVVDNLTTNGALLGPAIARRLVNHRAREVIVSLNAVDAEDYHRMMQVPAATFDRVLENVRGLVAGRAGAAGPSVVVQFLIDRVNFRQMARMYALGRSLGADRLVFSNVSAIPLGRIDEGVLLGPADAEELRPALGEILRADREDKRLQLAFPIGEWNTLLAELKREIGYREDRESFPVAPSFRDENGHCFFAWYTATIRGNGDIYPCCLLMLPDYKPLGNALNGHFVDHWKGPEFTRMREEQRGVLLAGLGARYDPQRHRILRPQCVEHGLCWLKNVYFRADDGFYRDLGVALDGARRRARWKALPGRVLRGVRRRVARVVLPVVGRPDPGSTIPYAPGSRLLGRLFPARRMKRDWDLRAREDALSYIDCGHGRDPETFWRSGEADLSNLVLRGIELEPGATVLEIGCGVGRLLKPFAGRAARVIGVDISPEMIVRARKELAVLPAVELFCTNGGLGPVGDETVDFVYSFIVFQHIPVKSAVLRYFREAKRVLRPGGLFRFQVDGRGPEARPRSDSWNGVRFGAGELARRLSAAGLIVLDIASPGTQYTWVTAMRRPENGAGAPRAARFRARRWRLEALASLALRLGLDPESTTRRIVTGEASIRDVAEAWVASSSSMDATAYVASAYAMILGRAADPEGLASYVAEIDGGIHRSNVVDCLIGSPEFDDRYRALCDETSSV